MSLNRGFFHGLAASSPSNTVAVRSSVRAAETGASGDGGKPAWGSVQKTRV